MAINPRYIAHHYKERESGKLANKEDTMHGNLDDIKFQVERLLVFELPTLELKVAKMYNNWSQVNRVKALELD